MLRLWRITLVLGAVSLCFGGAIVAQKEPSFCDHAKEPRNIQRPEYSLLRFDEDWSFLKERSLRSDFWDPIKYIPLHCDRPETYLSIGGEFRGTYEDVLNDNFSQVPFRTYSFGMQRFHLSADGHVNPRFRFFIQLESGMEQGRSGGGRPIDVKKLDFLNAFVDLRPLRSERTPTFRIGRQELIFGAGRLVSVREGPNVRQGFYGLSLQEKIGRWTLDGFASRPAQDNPGFFNNAPMHTVKFWGVYSSHPWDIRRGQSFDLYYFGLDRKSASFNSGTGRELRHTLGARLVAPAPVRGDPSRWIPHYDVETIFQFGGFGSRSIRAWGVASEFGYDFASLPLKPGIGLRADLSSGDRGNSNGPLGTFNPLFPRGGYFGILNDSGTGPVNFRDLHPQFRLTVSHNIQVDADWLIQWRQSLYDGVYDIPGNLMVPSLSTKERFVGHRPGLEVHWQIDRHMYVQADYGIFYAGSFLRAAGRPKNINYTSLWLGYKF